MKKTLLSLLLLILPFIGVAQDKIGIMNPQLVLASLPETQAIEQNLQNFVTQRQSEFEAKYSEWLEQVTEYQQNLEANVLTAQAQQEEEQRLAEAQAELEGMEQRFQVDLQNRRAELLEPVIQRMDVAMQEIAEENGIQMILNQATAGGDPIVYFISSNAMNITQMVIDRMSAESN